MSNPSEPVFNHSSSEKMNSSSRSGKTSSITQDRPYNRQVSRFIPSYNRQIRHNLSENGQKVSENEYPRVEYPRDEPPRIEHSILSEQPRIGYPRVEQSRDDIELGEIVIFGEKGVFTKSYYTTLSEKGIKFVTKYGALYKFNFNYSIPDFNLLENTRILMDIFTSDPEFCNIIRLFISMFVYNTFYENDKIRLVYDPDFVEFVIANRSVNPDYKFNKTFISAYVFRKQTLSLKRLREYQAYEYHNKNKQADV